MAEDGFTYLLTGGSWQAFACFKVMTHFPEDPWISSDSAADHDTVAPGFRHQPSSRGAVRHISVSDHRYGNRLFYFGDDIPVRLTGIKLLSGSSVDSHSGGTALLCDPGHFHRIHVLLIKALADLYCHRLFDGSHRLFNDLPCQNRIFHKSRAFPVVHHLGNRAAHVDIKNGKGPLLDPFCHLADDVRVGTEKL